MFLCILQLVMEYCIGSASNLLEGWFVLIIPLVSECFVFAMWLHNRYHSAWPTSLTWCLMSVSRLPSVNVDFICRVISFQCRCLSHLTCQVGRLTLHTRSLSVDAVCRPDFIVSCCLYTVMLDMGCVMPRSLCCLWDGKVGRRLSLGWVILIFLG